MISLDSQLDPPMEILNDPEYKKRLNALFGYDVEKDSVDPETMRVL